MTWVTFSTFYIDEIERAINLGPESAYVFGTFTLQEYRGRGIAASVMNTLLKQLFIRGIKKVYLIVNPENAPMLKVQKKQGGIVIGKIKFLRIWRFSSFGCQGVNNSVKQLSFLFNR
jgi:RimJ/RimL family protein N-acetyltransferase